MAHGLAIPTLLLVVGAATIAWSFAHTVGYHGADTPATTLAESPATVVSPSDVTGEAVFQADTPNTVAATVEGPTTYVDMVIKNPVKYNDAPAGRADGLPIDPTPDGQLLQR
ncbi:hypothetical protein GUJ93_ZPchr0008g12493 [Zizania palustris]|uniref:Uncharacterized protein n=1 Tax=Zizania palustris TaxID=103762 RepID=A0A8J5REX3_ZIZPA|nr:hypothetical protein GUJ93_ZPchr0008g12493 [Zizania palustris]